MFVSRKPRESDPWLMLKVWAFVVGAAFAMAGIYFRADWLIWVAIAALVVGFAARFLPDPGDEEGAEVEERPETF